MGSSGRRIALYSHDTMGIGHMRRNQLIAQALARSPLRPNVLLIAGAREANAFAMPPGVDCLTLPALKKGGDGSYRPRSLDVDLADLIGFRSRTIGAALEAFEPDVLIVDKVPRGVHRELDPVLEALRAGGRTRLILGLRDVLDDPETVRREWCETDSEDAILDYYNEVWVYGDPAVYDPVLEYRLPPAVSARLRYTGYLDRNIGLHGAGAGEVGPLPDLGLPPGRLVLCMAGGGQDGASLAEAFARADLPEGTNAVLVTGPFMPEEARGRLRLASADRPRLRVIEFVTDPETLLSRADRVVAMGGYNTVCEVLSFEKHALIVPRLKPRREQGIRADRLRALGLLDALHPDAVSPGAITAWLARDLGPSPKARDRVDLRGLARLPEFLSRMLFTPAGAMPDWNVGEAIEHVSA